MMSAMPDVLTVVDTVERCWDQEHAAREDGDLLVAECFARIAQDLYHTFAVGDRQLIETPDGGVATAGSLMRHYAKQYGGRVV